MAYHLVIVFVLINATILNSMDDAELKSKDMMRELKWEINFWQYERLESEKHALNRINQLLLINTSHPIKDGIYLIYFLKKTNLYGLRFTFGTKLVRWPYRCCVGFKDLYFDKDYLIDASYYYQVSGSYEENRIWMIPKEKYLRLAGLVDTFVIPLKNMEYFINLYYRLTDRRHTIVTLDQFLNMESRPHLSSVFDSESLETNNYKRLQSMIDMSMMKKFDNFTQFYLPIFSDRDIY